MLDAEHDDLATVLTDAIDHAIAAAAGRPDPGEVTAQWLADATRLPHQARREEVDDGSGDGLRQAFCQGPTRGRSQDEFVLIG